MDPQHCNTEKIPLCKARRNFRKFYGCWACRLTQAYLLYHIYPFRNHLRQEKIIKINIFTMIFVAYYRYQAEHLIRIFWDFLDLLIVPYFLQYSGSKKFSLPGYRSVIICTDPGPSDNVSTKQKIKDNLDFFSLWLLNRSKNSVFFVHILKL